MHCKRGDVVLVLFPDSNLRTAKRRPALVLQADNLNTGLPQTIIAMITSNMARASHQSRVAPLFASTQGKDAGILMDSIVMTDNLATSARPKSIGSWAPYPTWVKSTMRYAALSR